MLFLEFATEWSRCVGNFEARKTPKKQSDCKEIVQVLQPRPSEYSYNYITSSYNRCSFGRGQ